MRIIFQNEILLKIFWKMKILRNLRFSRSKIRFSGFRGIALWARNRILLLQKFVINFSTDLVLQTLVGWTTLWYKTSQKCQIILAVLFSEGRWKLLLYARNDELCQNFASWICQSLTGRGDLFLRPLQDGGRLLLRRNCSNWDSYYIHRYTGKK